MKTHKLATAAVLGIGAVALTGCGNGLATVSGQVTLNGEPLAGSESVRGTVYLFPEGGTGAPAVGLLDSDGRYTVSTGSQEGVLPGPYVVTVSASELIRAKQEGVAPRGRPLLPRRYADPSKSGLRVEVSEGANEFDFELEGAPDKPNRRRRR